MQYIFILGQASDLAQQEIISVLGQTNTKAIGSNFILAQSKLDINKLGGTIKIARFLESINNLDELTKEKWQKYLQPTLKKTGKNNFGFSLYNGSAKNYRTLKILALELKKELKNNGYKTRLVTGKTPELSSVIVAKNNLLNSELLVIKHDQGWLLGMTETIQDFVKYGQRDMLRPQRDDKSGMLPPKVAQMMLNLAGPDKNKVVLDPFCGSGTILQEAVLLGFDKIYGTDSSQKAVTDAQANIKWLKKQFKLKAEPIIKQIDVKKLGTKFDQPPVDLIVTEPFMGDARLIQRNNKPKTLEKITDDLQLLYQQAFTEFKKILVPKGQVIFVFPVFKSSQAKIHTLDENIIANTGFKLKKPTIIYSRPDQKVQREISVWQLN